MTCNGQFTLHRHDMTRLSADLSVCKIPTGTLQTCQGVVVLLVEHQTCDSHSWLQVLPRHYCEWPWTSYLHRYASVTKYHNLVPAKAGE